MSGFSKNFVLTRSEVLRFAIPSTLFSVLRHSYRAVDQFWIQHVSTEAQAAILFCIHLWIWCRWDLVGDQSHDLRQGNCNRHRVFTGQMGRARNLSFFPLSVDKYRVPFKLAPWDLRS